VNQSTTLEKFRQARGKLKIGDDWNAITIIALSQSRNKSLKLRYLARLYAKALVLHNYAIRAIA